METTGTTVVRNQRGVASFHRGGFTKSGSCSQRAWTWPEWCLSQSCHPPSHAKKVLTKEEILAAVKKAGYKFATKRPIATLNAYLNQKGKFVRRREIGN